MGEEFTEPQKEMQLKSRREPKKRYVLMSTIRDKPQDTHIGLSGTAALLPVASGLKDKWKRIPKRNCPRGLVLDTTVAVPSLQVGGLSDEHVSGVPPKLQKRKAGRASLIDEVSPH
jgi:hypothetical protein